MVWRDPLAVLLLWVFSGPAMANTPPALEVAWRSDQGIVYRAFDVDHRPIAQAEPRPVPLGSLWKLFVHAYLVTESIPAPDYLCQGQDREEAYCCDRGGRIGRDAALVASCGLFFAPARLGITPDDWRRFWSAKAPGIVWLADLTAMRPETTVPLSSLLNALVALPEGTREQEKQILLARVTRAGAGEGGEGLLRYFGGRLRIKSFSWYRPEMPGERLGGAAGWLLDGTPVWFAGPGTSDQVMAREGEFLAQVIPPPRPAPTAGCVVVDYFARYPLQAIERRDGQPARVGILPNGNYVARFANGVSLPFHATGELSLELPPGGPRLIGRLGLEEYVARVVDREADGREREAARALAVVVRSYLMAEARTEGNCLRIADASRTQRVSPIPASGPAREAAAFTTGLVLRGMAVGFHRDQPGPGRLAWTEAVRLGAAGSSWDAILGQAFPHADLAALNDPAGIPCEPLSEAENWLANNAPRWHRQLRGLAGFQPPPAPQVCRLKQGNPFSELDRGRIHVRSLRSSEDRITLAHEYVHLGLRHHPSSLDEGLVEQWARRLAMEVMP